jgi:hypothetical protein
VKEARDGDVVGFGFGTFSYLVFSHIFQEFGNDTLLKYTAFCAPS